MDRITRAPAIDPALASAGGGLLGMSGNLLAAAADAAVDGLIDTLLGALGGSGGAAGLGTELADLQDRTQVLEGVIGYAHAYANGTISTTAGYKRMEMTNQIGPIQGVTLTPAGSFVLGSKGLWVADGHAFYDAVGAGVTKVELQVRVYQPDGTTLHAVRQAEIDDADEVSLSVHLPFVVPTSGYIVQLWADAAYLRGIWSGSQYNGLSVEKVSSETS